MRVILPLKIDAFERRGVGSPSMAKRNSSAQWLQRQSKDPFVRKAQAQGYRSRAVYKLQELDQKDRLFRPGQVVVDLGAAPGGWSQYAAQRVGRTGTVVALDLLPMEPLSGVTILEGDFREATLLSRLDDIISNNKLDLVISDMAPNISGVKAVDQPRAMYLVELAQQFANDNLSDKGVFVTKVFQGEGFDGLIKGLRQQFVQVAIRKPKSSRPKSREVYVVARHRKL